MGNLRFSILAAIHEVFMTFLRIYLNFLGDYDTLGV